MQTCLCPIVCLQMVASGDDIGVVCQVLNGNLKEKPAMVADTKKGVEEEEEGEEGKY